MDVETHMVGFGNAFWTDRSTGDAVPEINLSAEYLSRGSKGLLETLLHEMAHLWNACVADIRDCPDGRYHNKKFKSAAEQFGLEVKRDGSRGWAYTRLTDVSRKAIKELKPLEDAFKTLRRKSIQAKPERYMSLIIDAELKDVLKNAITQSSMSQREFVETAIESAIEYWTGRKELS